MPKLLHNRGCYLQPSVQGTEAARALDPLPETPWPFPRAVAACLVICLALLSSGCLFKKQAKVFVPPPVAAKVTTPDRVVVVLPDAPGLSPAPSEPSIAPPAVANLPTLPAPPQPKPPPPKPRVTEPAPVIVDIPAPVPTTPAPRPGQVYSAEERRVYSKDFEDAMTSVTRMLTRIDARKLTSNQQQIANQVKALQTQAEQIKARDLATALDLAHRADILAKDLAARLP